MSSAATASPGSSPGAPPVAAAGSPTVFVVAPLAFPTRVLLQTDVLPALEAAGVRVVVLSPEPESPALAQFWAGRPWVLERLNAPPATTAGTRLQALRSIVRVLRKASVSGRASPAFAVKYGWMRAGYERSWPRWLSRAAHLAISQVLWRSRTARRLVLAADAWLNPHTAHAELFRRYRPELVIGGGLGYYSADELVMREANARGVKTAGVVSNWDNPTSMTYRGAEMDLVVAWSERMAGQIVKLHDVPRDRVVVAGVPHWDDYCRPGGLPTRGELCSRLGLAPDRRLIVLATFTPSADSEPYERTAEVLARAVAEDALGKAQLVLRLHPKFMESESAAQRRPYEQLAERFEHVHVHYPEMIAMKIPSDEDAKVLGALLKHADVLVNVFSTTTLEAFMLDTPVVMAAPVDDVAQDADIGRMPNPLRWREFAHLRPLVETGAARMAFSYDELLDHVQAYLEDPALDRDLRAEVARLECGPCDGHAGERAAGHLLELIGIGQEAA